MSTSYATQITREAPEIEAYKIGLLESARQLYGTPISLPAVEAAGLSQGQLQAADLARQGIGAYEPFLQAGSQAVTQGMGLAQQGAQQLGALDYSKQFGAAQGAYQAGLGAVSRLGALQGEAAKYVNPDLAASTQAYTAALNKASGIEDAGSAALTQGIGALGKTAYKDYMDPYQSEVIAATQADLQRQREMAETALRSQATRAGAFGGTREGVQQAILGGELARNEASVLANLRSQGFNAAQQNALNRANLYGQLGSQQAALRAQQAGMQGQLAGQLGQQVLQKAQLGQAGTSLAGQLAGQEAGLYGQLAQGMGGLTGQQAGIDVNRAQLLGSLGGQMGQLGVQQGALGQTLQGLGSSEVQLMAGIGGLEQQNAQAQLDAIRATQTQEAMLPFQQLGFVSDIYRGAPTTQMALTSQSAPTASPLQSAIGLGVAGLSAATGAQKAGLFG
jgi:hypothetical protein